MMRKWILSAVVLGISLSLPAQKLGAYWYVPRLLSDAGAASDRVHDLSPRFIPVRMQGYGFHIESDYALVHAEATPEGLQFVFRKGRAPRNAEDSWAPETEEAALQLKLGKDAIFTTINYSDIGFLGLWAVRAHPGHADWCVNPVENLDARNEVLCFASREDAQSFIDALATMAQASGTKLTPPLGMWAVSGVLNDSLRHVKQSGWVVSRIDPDGPPVLAGLRRGDLIYKVNDRPCSGSGSFFSAFRQAAWPASDGGDVRIVFLREGEHLSVILHYPSATE